MQDELVVVIPYDDPFHWVLAAEALEYHSREYKNRRVVFIETDYRRILVQKVKKLLGYPSIEMKIKEIFSESQVQFEKINLPALSAGVDIKSDSEDNYVSDDKFQRIAYRDLIYLTSSIRIKVSLHKRIIRDILKKMTVLEEAISDMGISGKDVILINGSFALDRLLKEKLQDANRVQIIEVGATRNQFELWIDAQSPFEQTRKMKNLWNTAKLSIDETEITVNQFINNREKIDVATGIEWTQHMKKNRLPDFDPERKLAVFYSSSDIEFLEYPADESYEWRTQQEALRMLLQCLDPDQWKVILRKHPVPRGGKSFESFSEWPSPSEFSNLLILEGDSEVNSYELAEAADIIFHYNSSIGPELILRGFTNIGTLGPTFWHELNPEGHIKNIHQLQERLKDFDFNNSYSSLLPWGIYTAKYGEPFKLMNWSGNPNWEYKGRPLEEPFGEWFVQNLKSKFTNVFSIMKDRK